MKGKLFVIESGTDSSGKATQTLRLFERLLAEGFNVRKVEYPDYESDSSALIKMYLKGEFGDRPEDVNCYAASAFYAVDRYASFQKNWREFYEAGGIVIADRYTTSNMVHQASKIEDEAEKEEYLEWLVDFEFEKFRLPEPDEVIFLDMPPSVSIELMRERNNKFTGESEKDIHEKSCDYLVKTYENARQIASKYGWKSVDCVREGNLRTIDEIHDEIYSCIIEAIHKA
ncbi:dTMP kinase [Peptoclostridium acidaminophilum]|nr:thymidylate kinase [Peptoclostridium acidaminophilum]